MSKNQFLKKSMVCLAIQAVFISGQVAANADLDSVGAESREKSIEVITVTSTRTVKSIQEVPMAVTAVSAAALRDNGITDIMSLDSLVPGMVSGVSGNDARPAMRGARTEQVEAADVAIAFYSNGVYRPRHGQALAGFIDLERVEVLRGPQGTQFGRNAFGGAIDVIAKLPELDVNEAGFATTFGNYNLFRTEGFANLALGDVTALRFSGVREVRDPYVENIFNPAAGMKDADMHFMRSQLFTELSDDATLNFRVEHWRDRSNGSGAFGYHILGVPIDPQSGLSSPTGTLTPRIGRSSSCAGGPANCGRFGAGIDETAQMVSDDPFKQAFDFAGVRDIEDLSISTELNWFFDSVNFKAIAAYMDYQELRLTDGDFSVYESTIDGNDIGSRVHSLELQWSSKGASPIEWVAGVYYFNEELENLFINGQFGTITDNVPDLTQSRDLVYASWLNQIEIDTRSVAIYGTATYSLSDDTRVLGGLRYTQDKRTWNIFGQDPNDLSRLNPSVPLTQDAKGDWDRVTWRLGVEHDLAPERMIYATASTGFLAGNAQGAFRGEQTYDEQTVTAYELGFKSMYFDRSVRLNLSLYHNQYRDLLSTRFETLGDTAVAFFGNAGEIDATGLEVELDWMASNAFTLGVRGALNNAEYGDFVTPNVFETGGETINGVANLLQLRGEQVQLTPDFSVTFLATYELDLANFGRLVSQVNLLFSDSYRTNDLPFSFGVQDSYHRLDASLNWFSANDTWRVRAYINNATNEEILLRTVRFGGNLAAADYANPRNFGVTVAYNF